MAYDGRRVFDSLTCGFPAHRISVILGGSGSGKSTILRLIGGLVQPQAGRIVVDGQDVTRLSDHGLANVRRKLGMLFQGGALLDSYTVFENVALPLRERIRTYPRDEHRALTEDQIAHDVRATLTSVGVADADDLLPNQLSGGMLRRVALARAIVRQPSILLCDEPFSGLDPASVKRIESLLVDINRKHNITIILVSHHVPSTMRMADHILLLLPNRAIEGSPAELRHRPDPEVTEFLSEGLDLVKDEVRP